MSDDGAGRAQELAAGLAAVRARLRAAVASAGRDGGDVTLVVVTKTFPASDVRLLARAGAVDVGESREPEASDKAAACSGLALTWHQVGQVQTNKASSVARWADVVHSVDRARLVTALARGAERSGRRVSCYLQVDLEAGGGGAGGAAAGRGGADPDALGGLADLVAGEAALDLAGIMAVAPRSGPPEALHRLRELSARLQRDHPAATGISAGMSGDLEVAVAAGATCVRVGRAVLGSRPPVR